MRSNRLLLGLAGLLAVAIVLADVATAFAQKRSVDKLYWNTISGSPFYQVAQPWMKDYVYQAEFKVLYKKVWLDK